MVGLYLLVGLCVVDRIKGPTALSAWPSILPRGFAFVLGMVLGTMVRNALAPAVHSVFASMLLFMLYLVPVLTGAGILMAGWRPPASFLLILTVPLGAALGFIDWYNLYRNARPKRISRRP